MTEVGLAIKRFFKKAPDTEVKEEVPRVDQILGRYLSDEHKLHKVLFMLTAAQQAVNKSKVEPPVVIVGSSVTGKSETDIDVYLDVTNLYSRDRRTGDYFWLDGYNSFLKLFSTNLKHINASEQEKPSTKVHNLIDRSQVSQLPTLMYGYNFIVRSNEVLVTTPKFKYSIDLKDISPENANLENVKSASKVLGLPSL